MAFERPFGFVCSKVFQSQRFDGGAGGPINPNLFRLLNMGISFYKSFPPHICSKDPQMQQDKLSFRMLQEVLFVNLKAPERGFFWLTPHILAFFEW